MSRRIGLFLCCAMAVIILPDETKASSVSLVAESGISWPTSEVLLRTLTLQEYNTRVVVLGTTLLGVAAGVIGTFTYLRGRAMMSDALSHATLPGIALAFLLIGSKDLAFLLIGATVAGVVGVGCVIFLRRFSRIKEDAAIGIVLSVFFGLGMALFSLIQQLNTGQEAGLTNFIYGRAASMISRDAWLMAGTALVVLACSILFYKELRLLCFDSHYAATQGYAVLGLDFLLMSLVVLTTVIGLQAVGLILVVALLIIPAACARFWTDRLNMMIALSAVFGAASGWLGACLSALLPKLPAGAVIVMTAGTFFFISMFFAPSRGILARVWRHYMLGRRIGYQHLLRAMAEFEEQRGEGCRVAFEELRRLRSWPEGQLRSLLRRAIHNRDISADSNNQYQLTQAGRLKAKRVLRNHRLWEVFLIRYADIAASHVDRDADEIEHVLSPEIIQATGTGPSARLRNAASFAAILLQELQHGRAGPTGRKSTRGSLSSVFSVRSPVRCWGIISSCAE